MLQPDANRVGSLYGLVEFENHIAKPLDLTTMPYALIGDAVESQR
jgi:hypothetical protein